MSSAYALAGMAAIAGLTVPLGAQAPTLGARADRPPGDPMAKTWAVYDQHCVACHGRNLEGGAAGSLVDGCRCQQ